MEFESTCQRPASYPAVGLSVLAPDRTVPACDVCTGTAWVPHVQLARVTVWRCAGCTALRALDRDATGAGAARPTQHFSPYDLDVYTAYYQAFRQRMFRRLLVELRRWWPQGRLVDVGCGLGWCLPLAHQAGYDAIGLEPTPQIAQRARTSTGLTVLTGEVDALGADGETYDVITLGNVLEHLPQPRQSLQHLASRLAPGGVIALVVPNVRGLLHQAVLSGYRLSGGRWTQGLEVLYQTDNACRHYYHFSPSTLRRLVEAVGLCVRRIWTQDIIDVSRLHLRTQLTAASQQLALAGSPPAKAVLRVCLALGRALGRGDELVVVAQKHP